MPFSTGAPCPPHADLRTPTDPLGASAPRSTATMLLLATAPTKCSCLSPGLLLFLPWACGAATPGYSSVYVSLLEKGQTCSCLGPQRPPMPGSEGCQESSAERTFQRKVKPIGLTSR